MAMNNRLWGAERIRGERAFTRHTCVQADHPEVHEASSQTPATRAEMVYLFAQSRRISSRSHPIWAIPEVSDL